MSALRPVADTPPRAVLYLRQSVSREDSISLDLQEAAGREYCRQRGYVVAAVESDPGITGRTWKRPAVQRVMGMIDDGAADVIVLWKWSRLSRSRRDWAVAVDKVESAGGRIESSTEQIDVSTAAGRFSRGMMAEFAAFESDRIGEVWKEVHASRLADGYAPNGKPRFGYRYDKTKKLHVPDPETAPILAEAYRRYVAGESYYTLVRWLNGAGVTTTADRPWTDRSLRRVMDSGFASGHISWNDKMHPGRHDALIELELWQAYLDARARRRQTPARTKRSQYVLSGLVRCGMCGGPMVANLRYGGRTSTYRCSRGKAEGPTGCQQGYVSIAVVEERVMEWLRELASTRVDDGIVEVRTRSVRRLDQEAELTRIAREVQKKDDAIARMTRHLADDVIGLEEYRSVRAELEAEKQRLVDRAEQMGREARSTVEDRPALARSLLEDWDERQVESRRAVLSQLVERVELTAGDRRGVRGVQGGASNAEIVIVEK